MSVVLGIIEGLTEFLPVSSTAHLRLAEAALSHFHLVSADVHLTLADPYWKMYTIVIQLGAILALMLLMLNRIVPFIRTFPRGERGQFTALTHPLTLVLLAFVCTAVPAKLLTKVIGENLESLTVIALALLVGGVVMAAIDLWASRREADVTRVEDMGPVRAVWIGFCQVLSAVVPGTSRSMSTIAAGQVAGMDRPSALEFSFLLSIPTMLAATGYALLKAVHPTGDTAVAPLHIEAEGWLVLTIGTAVSFIVAYVVVAWFLQWVRRNGFLPFAVYRVLLGGALLFWLHAHPHV